MTESKLLAFAITLCIVAGASLVTFAGAILGYGGTTMLGRWIRRRGSLDLADRMRLKASVNRVPHGWLMASFLVSLALLAASITGCGVPRTWADQLLCVWGLIGSIVVGTWFALFMTKSSLERTIRKSDRTQDAFIASVRAQGIDSVDIHIDFKEVGPLRSAVDDDLRSRQNLVAFHDCLAQALTDLARTPDVNLIEIGGVHLASESKTKRVKDLAKTIFGETAWTLTVHEDYRHDPGSCFMLMCLGRLNFLGRFKWSRTAVLVYRKIKKEKLAISGPFRSVRIRRN